MQQEEQGKVDPLDEMDVQTMQMITVYEVSAEAEMDDEDEGYVFTPKILSATINDLVDVVTRFACGSVYGDRIVIEKKLMPLSDYDDLDDWCGLLN